MAYASTTSGTQNFLYTCKGTEGDSFTIPFPTSIRSDTNYVAMVTLASSILTAQYLCNAPQSGYTTLGFTCITGVPVSVGDVLAVHVAQVST